MRRFRGRAGHRRTTAPISGGGHLVRWHGCQSQSLTTVRVASPWLRWHGRDATGCRPRPSIVRTRRGQERAALGWPSDCVAADEVPAATSRCGDFGSQLRGWRVRPAQPIVTLSFHRPCAPSNAGKVPAGSRDSVPQKNHRMCACALQGQHRCDRLKECEALLLLSQRSKWT